MSGLKYTPERAKQAAEQYATAPHSSPSNNSTGCFGEFLGCFAVLLIGSLVLILGGGLLFGLRSNEVSNETKKTIMNYVCDEIYTSSYDELENLVFNGKVTVEINNKKYSFNKTIKVSHPVPSDNIKEDVEFKKVTVTIGEIVNEYAAIPNEDESFTLEPMSDFRKRMHK